MGSILDGDGLLAELNDCLVNADIDGRGHGGSQGVDVEKLALDIRLDFNLEVVKDFVDLTRSFWCQHIGLGQWVDLKFLLRILFLHKNNITYFSKMVQNHVLSIESLVVVALDEKMEFFGQLIDGCHEFFSASRDGSANSFQSASPWCGGFSDAFSVSLGGGFGDNLLGAIAKVYNSAKAC